MRSFYRILRGVKTRLYILKKFQFKKIGRHSVIFHPIEVDGKKYITLGNNVIIGEAARIEMLPKWHDKLYSPNLVIGDNSTFEQFAHITAASNLYIGKNCTFSSRVMITTINHEYQNINKKITEQGIITRDVVIGDYCFIGMDVKIFPGVKIGNNVVIGANSIVMNDLPDFTVCVGIPAKPIKKYNIETGKWEKYEN